MWSLFLHWRLVTLFALLLIWVCSVIAGGPKRFKAELIQNSGSKMCPGNAQHYDIYVKDLTSPLKSIKVYSVCHDKCTNNTLYSWHSLPYMATSSSPPSSSRSPSRSASPLKANDRKGRSTLKRGYSGNKSSPEAKRQSFKLRGQVSKRGPSDESFPEAKRQSSMLCHEDSSKQKKMGKTSQRPSSKFRHQDPSEKKKMDALYEGKTQNATLIDTVGSGTIYATKDNRISRGHLTPRADFPLGALQYATDEYVNTAPQWIKFNQGGWHKLEDKVREYVNVTRKQFIVYTGTHGVLQMKDDRDKKLKEVYMDRDRKVAVPAIFWKIVHSPSDGKATAFVGINHPQPYDITTLCHDQCKNVGWMKAYREPFPKTGYLYCCKVADLRYTIDNNSPNLGDLDLLPGFP